MSTNILNANNIQKYSTHEHVVNMHDVKGREKILRASQECKIWVALSLEALCALCVQQTCDGNTAQEEGGTSVI